MTKFIVIFAVLYIASYKGSEGALLPNRQPFSSSQNDKIHPSDKKSPILNDGAILDSAADLSKNFRATSQNHQQSLAITPRNVAAVAGGNVTLVCEVSPGTMSRIIWIEFISRPGGEFISDGKQVGDHPHAERFSVSQESSTQFDLMIRDLKVVDAGEYMCEDTMTGHNGKAEVVVLDSEPVCESTFSSSNGVVVVGQQHSITCRVGFNTNSIIPTMIWTTHSWKTQPTIEEILSTTELRSKASFTVTKDMHNTYLSCKTSFAALASAPENTATNAPNWQHTYLSQTLRVS